MGEKKRNQNFLFWDFKITILGGALFYNALNIPKQASWNKHKTPKVQQNPDELMILM